MLQVGERSRLSDFMLDNGFDMILPVKATQDNGYLYTMVMNSEDISGEKPMLTFSKAATENFKVGDKVNPYKVWVVGTENTAGEFRLKLTDKEGDAVKTLEANGWEKLSLTRKVDAGSARVRQEQPQIQD
jgi:hypothetical protein